MHKILEEHRAMIESKMFEFHDCLRIRIKKFVDDLELYRKKVDELDAHGELEELALYTKKATSLDNRLVRHLQCKSYFRL